MPILAPCSDPQNSLTNISYNLLAFCLRPPEPPTEEFHAYELMQRRGQWTPQLGRVGDAASLYKVKHRQY